MQQTEDKREKIQALSLAKECYGIKLDLLTKATVIADVIRFVSARSKDKEKQKPSIEDDREESSEPDHYVKTKISYKKSEKGNW